MKYKISNTAARETLEAHVGMPLKYPNIYVSNPVVTGFEETIVPLIISDNDKEIEYGIWGLLPDNYHEDWQVFQTIIDTLTIEKKDFISNTFLKDSVNLKRCAVIVTGFFTTYLYKGEIFPFYVYAKNKKPFYLAGYYNKLADGFITFSILLNKVEPSIKKIQNLSDYSPKILSKNEKDVWVSNSSTNNDITKLLEKDSQLELKSHTIAKELYKMGITYNSMLEPVVYKNLPELY
ncbi:SOS response-associated peptidase family protein [Aquimarina agarilytica]|uniref:SOS response-associated peptidase family protein n=1 Tax=Aquimarina agarilytica TaxID=1087449 RepID=UPI00028913F9|nr:SOS response-associated peptidase family protein [Aquimarina agarilytica]